MALLCLLATYKFAQAKNDKSNPASHSNGYHIILKMPGVTDSFVYLLHYYGVPGPKVWRSDSARFNKKGIAEFRNTDPEFVGGIYLFMLSQKKTSFEFLLNAGDDMTIIAQESKLPEGIEFLNSPENVRFHEYQSVISAFGKKQEGFKKELEKARSAGDTADVRARATVSLKELTAWKRAYEAKYPGTLLANIFNAMELPEVPSGEHLLDDGKTRDSAFVFRYYKSHYWDKFDFRDDRLIYTPIYDGRLEEYISKFVVPAPDSLEKESDMLLQKAKGTKDMFHYTLWWLTYYLENSKIMGLDEAFVYLVENYYMKGDATWLSSEELNKYIERATKIAPNILNNLAPEIKLPNVITKKEESMQSLKAKYTLIIFYSPTCGHCQHELPIIDSLYEAVLKDKGLKVYTVATEGDEKAISDFLVKLKVDNKWTNTWDPSHISNYHNQYDVYSTPTIYLLDEKKKIKGKRLDHSNIQGLIEMIERNNAKKEGTKS